MAFDVSECFAVAECNGSFFVKNIHTGAQVGPRHLRAAPAQRLADARNAVALSPCRSCMICGAKLVKKSADHLCNACVHAASQGHQAVHHWGS